MYLELGKMPHEFADAPPASQYYIAQAAEERARRRQKRADELK